MDHLIKYQMFILDLILLKHYTMSYDSINESKNAQNELIYQRSRNIITADAYKKHHYAHMTRQAFLESEIDRVRVAITDSFITGAGANNRLAKSTALADYSVSKGDIKTHLYSIAHTGLHKTQIASDKLSDRETKIRDYTIRAYAYAEELFNEDLEIKQAIETHIPDRVLAAICSNNLLVTSNSGEMIPILSIEKIQDIIENHTSKINRKAIPEGTPLQASFLDFINERKAQHLALMSAEDEKMKKMNAPKKNGSK